MHERRFVSIKREVEEDEGRVDRVLVRFEPIDVPVDPIKRRKGEYEAMFDRVLVRLVRLDRIEKPIKPKPDEHEGALVPMKLKFGSIERGFVLIEGDADAIKPSSMQTISSFVRVLVGFDPIETCFVSIKVSEKPIKTSLDRLKPREDGIKPSLMRSKLDSVRTNPSVDRIHPSSVRVNLELMVAFLSLMQAKLAAEAHDASPVKDDAS